MRPTRLLDPKFQWIPAERTDIRETFKRIREELRQSEKKVVQIKRKRNG